MSETISRPFTFLKEGVFYFSRRIPKELRDHYTSPRIAYSLSTKSPKIAEARAKRAADQLYEYWYHLRCRDADLPGKHMLRLQHSTTSEAHHQPPSISTSSVFCQRRLEFTCSRRARSPSDIPKSC